MAMRGAAKRQEPAVADLRFLLVRFFELAAAFFVVRRADVFVVSRPLDVVRVVLRRVDDVLLLRVAEAFFAVLREAARLPGLDRQNALTRAPFLRVNPLT